MAKIDLYKAKEMSKQGKSPVELAAHFKCSLTAIYRGIKKFPRLSVPASIEALTEKQLAFIKFKNQGLSGTEAALRAYDTADRKSAREISSQLLAKPEIKAAMSDWLEYCGCGRHRRAERLTEFVENPDPVIALPALREAMKAGNDYPNQKIEVEKSEIQYVVSFTPIGTPEDQSRIISISPNKDALLLPESFHDREDREQRHRELRKTLSSLPRDKGDNEGD